MEQLHALNRFMEGKAFHDLHAGLDISERFRRIRHNYALFQQLVDAGFESWMGTNQYEVGDWVSIFTPIEAATWHDIRCGGLPLWPQLPVDRFFVDFGNPIAKVALECDGAQWHDEARDARRDAVLHELGWKVWRAPGWRCNRVMERPDDFPEWSPEEQDEFWRRKRAETMQGLIDEIRPYLEST
jgi:hypothetical protein